MLCFEASCRSPFCIFIRGEMDGLRRGCVWGSSPAARPPAAKRVAPRAPARAAAATYPHPPGSRTPGRPPRRHSHPQKLFPDPGQSVSNKFFNKNFGKVSTNFVENLLKIFQISTNFKFWKSFNKKLLKNLEKNGI